MDKFSRRDFIKTSGIVAGGLLLLPCCRYTEQPYRFFSPEEADCIIALSEQIIPHDKYPGATDAGVIYYIDRQLSSVFHYDQQTYRLGIESMQLACNDMHKKLFQDLPVSAQIMVMEEMEAGNLNKYNWPGGNLSSFFNLVLKHTMQAFYGSPIHGGNKDYMSFEMLQIDYPLVIGQNRYNS
ncbi:MAG: gluconate 2-dehydrogenase subunit 3 family protein [Prolixibacteraceae bacterium]|nr:gluconate 2-dehydrogenase subunit 3 family protein [Prolixibacteraceae bacterium]